MTRQRVSAMARPDYVAVAATAGRGAGSAGRKGTRAPAVPPSSARALPRPLYRDQTAYPVFTWNVESGMGGGAILGLGRGRR
jgi:hypothetical protein